MSVPVRRLLGVMELDVPYTAPELMGMLGLRSREAFRKNYLRQAMALTRGEMALPEKPSSRDQRYIRAAGSM